MGDGLDVLTDTLALVLREFGRHSFDLERQEARKTQSTFDRWAQHVLTGVAPPAPVPTEPGHRAFGELKAQFTAHRKAEQAEFSQSREALRDVVWTFVSSLNREMAADRATDAKLGQTLASVATSLQSAAPADLRRLAVDTVRQVQAALAERRARQEQYVSELAGRVERLGSQLEVARRESTTDALTQLFNRRAFDEQLERTVQLQSLASAPASLILVDIDHFKTVNDTHGHPAGDAVLKAVASACVRTFKRKSDFVARYGGEELVVLLRDAAVAEAAGMGERLRAAVEALVTNDVRVTVSCGVAERQAEESPAAWVARADAALYRAKHEGRNRVIAG